MHKITVISILNFEMYCGSDDAPREGAAEGAATPSGDTEKAARRIRYVGHNDRRGKGNGKREEKGSKNDSKTHKKEVEKSPVSGQSLNPSKEIKNNISSTSTTAPAYVREEAGKKDSAETEAEYFERLKTDRITLEALAVSAQTDLKNLSEIAARFFAEQTALDKKHADFNDFKKHFLSWARIELRKSSAPAGPKGYTHQTTTTKPNSYGTDSTISIRTAGEDRLRCRRSTDPGDPKTKNYKAAL